MSKIIRGKPNNIKGLSTKDLKIISLYALKTFEMLLSFQVQLIILF